MAPNVGDRYRITAVMQLYGSILIENVYDLRVSASPSGTDNEVVEEAAAWLDEAYTDINMHISNQLTYQEVRGFKVTGEIPLVSVPWPSLVDGDEGTDALPSGACALALFYTDKSRTLGRKFLGGWTEGSHTNGVFIPAVLTSLGNYALSIAAGPALTAGGMSLSYGVYTSTGVFHGISRVRVSAIAAYQRRRRQGTGD